MKKFFSFGILAKIAVPVVVLAVGAVGLAVLSNQPRALTLDELDLAQSLTLTFLPPLPPDLSNAVGENDDAIALGKMLFNDTGFSSNGVVACATCHLEARQFQDDLPLAQGVGTTARRTMPLRGIGYSSWFFWDGHRDSLWSQALGPVESVVEHNFTRTEVALRLKAHYQIPYEALFGPLPDLTGVNAASPAMGDEMRATWDALSLVKQNQINEVFANFGKSIAAFERTLMPEENRFDRYVATALADGKLNEDSALSAKELAGYRLFTGKAECIQCHNGPRLMDEFFHNTGVKSPANPVTDFGRRDAIALIDADLFTCAGDYSDAGVDECGELRFMERDLEVFERAFKTPSLRGVAGRPPYMHAGQIRTLSGVVEHYNRALPAPAGHSEIKPLHLTTPEKSALIAFLKTL